MNVKKTGNRSCNCTEAFSNFVNLENEALESDLL